MVVTMDSSMLKLYVAYFSRPPMEVEQAIQAEQDLAIVVDTTGHRGNHDVLALRLASHCLEPEPCDYLEFDRPPLPRPPRTKLRIRQVPQQSFRQVMRSVNRNR